MWKVIKGLYLLFNTLIILALLALHFVIKEQSFESSVYYYSFPIPVIIFIVLALSIFLGKFRKYNLILTGLLLIIWLGRSFRLHVPETIEESDVEIVFWNASRRSGFPEAFKLNGGLPDVIVLTESKSLDTNFLKKTHPSYYFYKSETDMVVCSKYPIKVKKEEASNFHTYLLFFETNGINMCAIDVQGSTDVPRSWELGFVNKQIEIEPNTIILGDFNLPYESKYLDKLKANYQHAFSEKGNGFRETWFWNIPLLSLDHIWVSNDIEILKTEKIYTFKSDHNMLKTVVRR